jgi:hypothetical protein
MGVSEMTRFGMKESDFDNLARMMADIIVHNKKVGDEVAEYRGQFRKMFYCLELEETLCIAPSIFESIFPSHEYFQSVAAALNRL